MSRRMNRTICATISLGINPYGWGSGKARKGSREQRTPVDQTENNIVDIIAQVKGDCKDGKFI